MVFQVAFEHQIPIVMLLSGGENNKNNIFSLAGSPSNKIGYQRSNAEVITNSIVNLHKKFNILSGDQVNIVRSGDFGKDEDWEKEDLHLQEREKEKETNAEDEDEEESSSVSFLDKDLEAAIAASLMREDEEISSLCQSYQVFTESERTDLSDNEDETDDIFLRSEAKNEKENEKEKETEKEKEQEQEQEKETEKEQDEGGNQLPLCARCKHPYKKGEVCKIPHPGDWHSQYSDCSYIRCGIGLKRNIGKQHWSCCFSVEQKSSCTKAKHIPAAK